MSDGQDERGTRPGVEALAGAERADRHVRTSSGFAVVPAAQEEKLQLRGDNLSR